MKTYHYSTTFRNSELTYHGDFETSFTDFNDIKAKGSRSLQKKMIRWKFEPDDILTFEIYDNDRNIIFTWKK